MKLNLTTIEVKIKNMAEVNTRTRLLNDDLNNDSCVHNLIHYVFWCTTNMIHL